MKRCFLLCQPRSFAPCSIATLQLGSVLSFSSLCLCHVFGVSGLGLLSWSGLDWSSLISSCCVLCSPVLCWVLPCFFLPCLFLSCLVSSCHCHCYCHCQCHCHRHCHCLVIVLSCLILSLFRLVLDFFSLLFVYPLSCIIVYLSISFQLLNLGCRIPELILLNFLSSFVLKNSEMMLMQLWVVGVRAGARIKGFRV